MYNLCILAQSRSFDEILKMPSNALFFTSLAEMLKNGFLSCLSVIKSNTFVFESFEKN